MPKSRAHFLSAVGTRTALAPARYTEDVRSVDRAAPCPVGIYPTCALLFFHRQDAKGAKYAKRISFSMRLAAGAHWHPAIGAENQRLLAFCAVPAPWNRRTSFGCHLNPNQNSQEGRKDGKWALWASSTPGSRDAKSANFFFEFEVAIDLLAVLSSAARGRTPETGLVAPFRPSDLL